MFAVIGLHCRICPYGLPGGLHEIRAHQSVRAHRHAHRSMGAPALVHPWGQTYIAGQMFHAPEPSQVAQFAKYAAGDYTADARYAPEQHIILLVMYLAISSELCRYITQFFVDEPEEAHSALQSRFCGRVPENPIVQPFAVPVAPMVVIELLRDLNALIEQLHLDVGSHPAEVLYQVIAPPKKTAKLLTFPLGNSDTFQTTVPEFTADKLGIDTVRLGMALLALTVDIRRVHHQGSPSIGNKTTMGIIPAATCLIGRTYLMAREMFRYIDQ